MSPEITTLLKSLAKLPGLGPRSARRILFDLVKKREMTLKPLIASLTEVENKVSLCKICGNIDTQNPCAICQDTERDPTLLCIVEEAQDVWTMERVGLYKGYYHVLGGLLRALDGVGPEDLAITTLVQRLENNPHTEEVIFALGTTVEGQTTLHYLLDETSRFPLRFSSLAQGLPLGGNLDYLDDGTIATAFQLRRRVEESF